MSGRMYGKFISFCIALLTLSIAFTPAVIASSTTPVQSTEEANRDVLSEARITFRDGQGTHSFDYEKKDHSKITHVNVKNTGTKNVNYRLISPTGWVWVKTTIQPGNTFTSGHAFGSQLEGKWSLQFDTDDGSPASLEISVLVKP